MGESDTPRPRKGTTQGSVSSVLTPPTGLPSIEDIETSLSLPTQRTGVESGAPTAPPVAPPPPAQAPPGTCQCGHAHEAHEHYRAGDDCGACGAEVCSHYRPATAEEKKGLLHRLGLRR
ncbi:hypothetical protein [Pseudonocardia pini]|uniref:hypothetical protein n=1 Tax=Pseudonocardia pini TaxID=2758030 RepID=UPI0015F03500|nr:hypothetical protein [Pseudonocardia pini]